MSDISSYLGKQIVSSIELPYADEAIGKISKTYDLSEVYDRKVHSDILNDFFKQNGLNINASQFEYVLDAIDEEITKLPQSLVSDVLNFLTQIQQETSKPAEVLADQDYQTIFDELNTDSDGHLEYDEFLTLMNSLLGDLVDEELTDNITDYYFSVVGTAGIFTKENLQDLFETIDGSTDDPNVFNKDGFSSQALKEQLTNQDSDISGIAGNGSDYFGTFLDVTEDISSEEDLKKFNKNQDSYVTTIIKSLSDVSGGIDNDKFIENSINFTKDINSFVEAQDNIPPHLLEFSAKIISKILTLLPENHQGQNSNPKNNLLSSITNTQLKEYITQQDTSAEPAVAQDMSLTSGVPQKVQAGTLQPGTLQLGTLQPGKLQQGNDTGRPMVDTPPQPKNSGIVDGNNSGMMASEFFQIEGLPNSISLTLQDMLDGSATFRDFIQGYTSKNGPLKMTSGTSGASEGSVVIPQEILNANSGEQAVGILDQFAFLMQENHEDFFSDGRYTVDPSLKDIPNFAHSKFVADVLLEKTQHDLDQAFNSLNNTSVKPDNVKPDNVKPANVKPANMATAKENIHQAYDTLSAPGTQMVLIDDLTKKVHPAVDPLLTQFETTVNLYAENLVDDFIDHGATTPGAVDPEQEVNQLIDMVDHLSTIYEPKVSS